MDHVDKLIATVFITTTIVTIIPNLMLAYKYFIKKDFDDIFDTNFIYFMSLYMFVIVSILQLGNFIFNQL